MAKQSTQHMRYDSVTAIRMMAAAPADQWKKPHHARKATEYTSGKTNRESWHGIRGGADAVMNAMINGLPAADIESILMDMRPTLPRAIGVGRKLVRGEFGDELDIHAVYRGQTDRAWTSRQRLIRKGRTSLKIIVDVGGNCASSADVLKWRGIAGAALADVMTKASYQVEIVAAWAVRGHNRDDYNSISTMECTVKHRGAGLDLAMLAATIGLPGFFRTVGFAAIVRCVDELDGRLDDCLGHHVNIETLIPSSDTVAALFVPASISDRESAMEWVRQSVHMLQGARI